MKVRLVCLLLLGLALVRPAGAQSGSTTNAPGHRFLFLIDASAMMAPARAAIEQTVQDLIASGAAGQMQAGDEFALWPYRLRVITDAFAPLVWTPTNAVTLAKTAGDFLRNLTYQDTGLFYLALVEMFRVIKASPTVTVFLISDGAEMLQGTPFDLYANTIYRERAAQLRREKKPFVTALLAVDGNVIDCTVGVGGEKLTVPAVPPELRPKRSEPAAAPSLSTTPRPPSAPSTTPPTKAPPQKKVTQTTASPPPQPPPPAPAPSPAARSDAPAPAMTATAPMAATVAAPSAPPPAPPPPAVADNAPAVAAASVSLTPTAPAPAPPPAPPVTPATQNDAAPAPARPPPAPAPAAEAADAPASLVFGMGEQRLLWAGLGLLLVAALIAVQLLRRHLNRRPRASLITRSMRR